jgi:hypothetical protein
LKRLNQFIETDFVLVIQWDGFAVNNLSWSDRFFDYDYIGAKWIQFGDRMTVGNGGFSLRSKRLLDAISSHTFYLTPDTSEDIMICRNNRRFLENQYGLRFASEDVADMFSYEAVQPTSPTFGFHGFHNMWSHVSDVEMIYILDTLDSQYFNSREFLMLMLRYYALRNDLLFAKCYILATTKASNQDLFLVLRNNDVNAELAQSVVYRGKLLKILEP